MRQFNFSKKIAHIVCGVLATQHARCHKEHYSPRGQAVSTSHVLGGDSRQRNQFAILSTISSQERRVFSKFHDFYLVDQPKMMFFTRCTNRVTTKNKFSKSSNFVKIQDSPRRQKYYSPKTKEVVSMNHLWHSRRHAERWCEALSAQKN